MIDKQFGLLEENESIPYDQNVSRRYHGEYRNLNKHSMIIDKQLGLLEENESTPFDQNVSWRYHGEHRN